MPRTTIAIDTRSVEIGDILFDQRVGGVGLVAFKVVKLLPPGAAEVVPYRKWLEVIEITLGGLPAALGRMIGRVWP